MRICRNNHYVPQMYLKNWEEDGKIYVYHLLVPNDNYPLWIKRAIKRTASMKDLYTDIEQGLEYDRTERLFAAKYETPAKIPIEKVCKDSKLERKDWEYLIDYTLLQFVRTPTFYFSINEHSEEFMPPVLDSITNTLSELKTPPDQEKVEKDHGVKLPIKIKKVKDDPKEDTVNYEIETVAGKNSWLFLIDAVMAKDSKVRRLFHEMKWSILTAYKNDSWPTSDTPVVMCEFNNGILRRLPMNGSLGEKNRAILFPISPQKALIGEWYRTIRWREKTDSALCKSVKKAICDNASYCIYNNKKDPDVEKYRERVVDIDLFKSTKDRFDNWHDNYILYEGPYLN